MQVLVPFPSLHIPSPCFSVGTSQVLLRQAVPLLGELLSLPSLVWLVSTDLSGLNLNALS